MSSHSTPRVISLNHQTHRRLKALSANTDMSMARITDIALTLYLDRIEKRQLYARKLNEVHVPPLDIVQHFNQSLKVQLLDENQRLLNPGDVAWDD